ncbi:MAG: 4Fe-4S dicluster domain-containing protein [Bacillota bacterium]
MMMLAAEKTPFEEKPRFEIKAVIQVEHCKGCGICTAHCPQKILVLGEQLNSYGYPVVEMTDVTACKGCLRCVMMCPDVVFTFTREEKDHAKNDERQ